MRLSALRPPTSLESDSIPEDPLVVAYDEAGPYLIVDENRVRAAFGSTADEALSVIRQTSPAAAFRDVAERNPRAELVGLQAKAELALLQFQLDGEDEAGAEWGRAVMVMLSIYVRLAELHEFGIPD